MLHRLLLVLLLTGLTAACSGSSDPEEPDTGAPAVLARAGLIDLYVGDDVSDADVAEGECFADELLSRLGRAELESAGILDEDGVVADSIQPLDAATADSWVDAQFACSDYVEASTRALVTQSKGAVEPRSYARCLRGSLTESQLRAAVAATLTGDLQGPEVAALASAQSSCAKAALPPD